MAQARLLCLVLLLTGCDAVDPYNRAGMWQPSGANAVNLAAMVQRPSDLIRGRGASGNSGIEAGPPVNRLWDGKSAPLPSSTSQATSTGQGRNATQSGGTAP